MRYFAYLLCLGLLPVLFACQKEEAPPTPPPPPMEEEFTVTEYPAADVPKTYERPAFAHYMPWFETPEFAEFGVASKGDWGLHWTMATQNPEVIDAAGRRQIAAHFYPLIGPYDNGEPHYLEYAVACLKLAGFDGVLIDYAGTTEVYDGRLLHDHTEALLPWLERAGLQFGIVYEDRALQNALDQGVITDPVAEGKAVLQYLHNNYFAQPNYLQLRGRPVLLNFGPQALYSDAEWNAVFADLPPLDFITLPYTIANRGLTTSAAGEFAWVQEVGDDQFYQHCGQYDLCVGGAMPGFFDFYEEGGWGDGYPTYDPQGGLLFSETLERAAGHDLDLLQVITWNDFGEGTMIEPTVEFGYERLEQVQAFLGVDYRAPELALAVDLYQKRKAYAGEELANKKLDQVFFYLISLQLTAAQQLLAEL